MSELNFTHVIQSLLPLQERLQAFRSPKAPWDESLSQRDRDAILKAVEKTSEQVNQVLQQADEEGLMQEALPIIEQLIESFEGALELPETDEVPEADGDEDLIAPAAKPIKYGITYRKAKPRGYQVVAQGPTGGELLLARAATANKAKELQENLVAQLRAEQASAIFGGMGIAGL